MQHSVMECCIFSCLAIHISAAGRKTLGVQKKILSFFIAFIQYGFIFFERLILRFSNNIFLKAVLS